MLHRLVLLTVLFASISGSFAYAGSDGARVTGDFRISGAGSGLVFPDGSMQYKAALQGPAGPQGIQGIQGAVGPQGPKGDTGPAGLVTLESICSAISAGGAELPSFCTTPAKFTMAWLSGRTLYNVWFGEGNAANGDRLNNVPVVIKVVFGSNGIVQATGLLNGFTGSAPYGVTASGGLYYDNTNEVNTIVSGGTSQYIKTYFTMNGVFDNVDLFFFDQAAAMAYARTLTSSIPK